MKYAVHMMESELGIAPKIAGNISALLPIGTILITPIIGIYLDTKGKGALLMIVGSILLTLVHLTFALAPLTVNLSIFAIIVLGISFSLIPAAMWPSVPKIIEERYLGSAFAIIFWIQNIGLTLIPMLIGYVLQKTNPGIHERFIAGDPTAIFDYTIPMLIFAFLGLLAIVFAFLLKKDDKKMNYGLDRPNRV